MSTSLFINKGKDTLVTMPDLARMPDPESLGRWHRPHRYDEIVEELTNGAKRAGYDIIKNEMALSRTSQLLLGVMQLQNGDHSVGNLKSDIALGFRASTHKISALKCVAGEHVFMCSNLIMSGDMFVVQKKFTIHMKLRDAVDNGFERFAFQHANLNKQLEIMATAGVNDQEAKAMIFDSITKRNMPLMTARHTAGWFFGEEYGGPEKVTEDCAPRTMFGLHNAFTRSLRDLPAQSRFEHTQTVGKIFGL